MSRYINLKVIMGGHSPSVLQKLKDCSHLSNGLV